MKSQNSSTKFAGCGIKNTVQRKLVFAILEGENRPLTADEIYVKLKEKKETSSLSTIYRILEVFAEKGLILKTSIFNEKKFTFEINRLEHKHYLICAKCNKNIEIEGCPLEKLEAALTKKTRYKIVGHKLDIYGYCPECQEKLEHESETEVHSEKEK